MSESKVSFKATLLQQGDSKYAVRVLCPWSNICCVSDVSLFHVLNIFLRYILNFIIIDSSQNIGEGRWLIDPNSLDKVSSYDVLLGKQLTVDNSTRTNDSQLFLYVILTKDGQPNSFSLIDMTDFTLKADKKQFILITYYIQLDITVDLTSKIIFPDVVKTDNNNGAMTITLKR